MLLDDYQDTANSPSGCCCPAAARLPSPPSALTYRTIYSWLALPRVKPTLDELF